MELVSITNSNINISQQNKNKISNTKYTFTMPDTSRELIVDNVRVNIFAMVLKRVYAPTESVNVSIVA